MTEFYVIMLKRKDGKVYTDLHKTTLKIYLNYEDAEYEFNKGGLYEGYFCKDYYHIVKLVACLPDTLDDYYDIVKLVACLPETLDELAQGLPKVPPDAL